MDLIDFHVHLDPARASAESRPPESARTAIEVVSVDPRYFSGASTSIADIRHANDLLADAVRRTPDTMRGLATLPVHSLSAALDELERAMGFEGFVGASIGTSSAGPNWDDRRLDPIFDLAVRSNAILFFHAGAPAWDRGSSYAINETVGRGIEAMLTGATLILGGVLVRHPTLKLVLAFGGGPLSFGIGRIERGWHVRREARVATRVPPGRFLQSIYVDTAGADVRTLMHMLEHFGVDRVLFGSGGENETDLQPSATWISDAPTLSLAQKRLVLYQNGLELLQSSAPSTSAMTAAD